MDLHTIETYLRPADLSAIDHWDTSYAWLAGGTWLFSEAQPHLKTLIDLEPLHWLDIEITEEAVAIGATCTLAQLQRYDWRSEWSAIAGLKAAISALAASFKVTNVATIGGNLCLALSVGVVAPVMMTLDASYEIWHPSGTVRFVAAKAFQTDHQKTVLQAAEVLRRVWIPTSSLTWNTDFQRFGIAATDPALATVTTAINPEMHRVRIAIAASLPAPHLLEFDTFPSHTELLQAIESSALPWVEDYRASAVYRRHLTEVLIQRSLHAQRQNPRQ